MKLQLYPFNFHTYTKPSDHIFFTRNPIKIFILLVLGLASSKSEAQWSDTLYDFSSFVLPNIDYRGLDFSGELRGSRDRQGSTSFSPVETETDIFTDAYLSYFRFLNTTDKQLVNTMTGRLGFSWEHEKSATKSSSLSVSPVLSGSRQMRWYNGKKFIELSFDYLARITPETEKAGENRYNTVNGSYRAMPFLLLGKGRIEPVTDVNIAQFLLRDLAVEGLLNTTLTNDELNALGHQMARARNRRVFDFRLKRIYELKNIDSLIQTNGWVDGQSIDYFAILNDNWAYAYRPDRGHGKRLSYGLAPFVSYNHMNSKNTVAGQTIETDLNSKEIYASAMIQYRVEKPITMTKQRSYGGELSVGYDYSSIEIQSFIDSTMITSIRRRPAANFVAYYGFGYYPNSRTRWINELTGRVRVEDIDNHIRNAVNLGFNSSVYYYLSPRAQLLGNLGASWTIEDNISTPGFSATGLNFPSGLNFPGESPLYNSNLYRFFSRDRLGVNLNVRILYALF